MEAPFYIGQKVVAIRDHWQGVYKKGDVLVVDGIMPNFCKCPDEWVVSVGIAAKTAYMSHLACGAHVLNPTKKWWFNPKNFAPIQENRERIKYVAVSEDVREKAQEVVVESSLFS